MSRRIPVQAEPRPVHNLGADRLAGALRALVTPFVAGGDRLDEHAFGDLVTGQIAEGAEGLVVAGMTGEAPPLTVSAHDRLLRVAVEAAARRMPVIAGSGTNCTRFSVELAQAAQAAGVDAALLGTPSSTSRCTRGPTGTSPTSPVRSGFHSCSTTCRAARASIQRPTRSCVPPSSRTWSVSRMRRGTSSDHRSWPARPGPASSSSRAMRRPRSPPTTRAVGVHRCRRRRRATALPGMYSKVIPWSPRVRRDREGSTDPPRQAGRNRVALSARGLRHGRKARPGRSRSSPRRLG